MSVHASSYQGVSLPPLSVESFGKSADFAYDGRPSFTDSSATQSFNSFTSSRSLPPPADMTRSAHPASTAPSSFVSGSSGYAAAPSTARPAVASRSNSYPDSASQSKPARKGAKPHVQAACYNCKKAHLACDVSRPCQRCIGNGKTDTCRDVEHKKRGRPRLRDDRGQKVVPPTRYPTTQALSLNTQAANSHKDIRPAYPRSQFNSSLMPGHDVYGRRYTTDMLSVGHDKYGMGANLFGASSMNLTNEAVAFLDMDLKISKTNDAFKNTFYSTMLEGRRLDELVDGGNLGTISFLRDRIKGEQQHQNAHYIASLRSENQNQIPDFVQVNWQAASAPFTCHSQNLVFRISGQQYAVNAQLRLAKHELTYFVVLWIRPSPYSQDVSRTSSPFYSAQPLDQFSGSGSFNTNQQYSSGYALVPGAGPQTMDSYANQSLHSAPQSPTYYSFQPSLTSPLAGRGEQPSFGNYMSQSSSAAIPRSAQQPMYFGSGYGAGTQSQSAPTSATDQRYFFGQDMMGQQTPTFGGQPDPHRSSYNQQTHLPPIDSASFGDDDDHERRKKRRLDIHGLAQ